MEKKKRKKPADLITQAEQIAARAWDEDFKCPYHDELMGMVTRLGEIGQSCLACSKENHLRPRIYWEIKLILALWRGLMEQELEED